jgi:hypothetical protein
MPLLQPFVTPGLVLLGAGIGAAVASPPAEPESRDVAPATAQELPVGAPGGAEVATTGPVGPVVAGIGDAAAALSVPPDMVTVAPSPAAASGTAAD